MTRLSSLALACLGVLGVLATACGPVNPVANPVTGPSPVAVTVPRPTLATATLPPATLPSVALPPATLPSATLPPQTVETTLPSATPTESARDDASPTVVTPVANPDCSGPESTPLPIRQLEIVDGERRLLAAVEVADSEAERSRGLMCRTRLEAGTGMAFSWDVPVSGGFWMYNTYIPLDLLYVAGDGQVIAVRSMTPCPRSPGEDQASWTSRCIEESRPYAPGAAYQLAVELPAGWLEARGFDPAASVRWLVSLK